MNLKNKRILITAGPTWVAIDSVRVISNIATGETGILLAGELAKLKAKVTLLLGPVGQCCLRKDIKLIHFTFFDELKRLIVKEISSGKFDIVVHSAAVADYRPQEIFKQKVGSGIRRWKLTLVPTPKIIDLIRKKDKALFLVGFKFKPKASRKKIINEARLLMDRTKLDLTVANTIHNNRYSSYILNDGQICGPLFSKKNMTKRLVKLIGEYYGRVKAV